MIIQVKDEDDIGGLSCPLAKRGYIAGIRNRNCHISFISNNSRSLWPLLVGNCQNLVKYHNEDNNDKDNNKEENDKKDKDNTVNMSRIHIGTHSFLRAKATAIIFPDETPYFQFPVFLPLIYQIENMISTKL